METQITENLAKLSSEVERLSDDIKGLSLQLECTHLHQVIAGHLRDLRGEAGEATFAKEGERGYVPRQDVGDGFFELEADEDKARAGVKGRILSLETWLDGLVSPLRGYGRRLYGLEWNLAKFCKSVREVAYGRGVRSLNQLAFSVRELREELLCMDTDIHREYEEEEEKTRSDSERVRRGETRPSRPKWAAEKLGHDQLPIPE
jgi:hypothetical protein